MYVLDEPSIGLHQADNYRLIETLKKLRDLGNTVIVVEHDEETMEAAEHLIDVGLALEFMVVKLLLKVQDIKIMINQLQVSF